MKNRNIYTLAIMLIMIVIENLCLHIFFKNHILFQPANSATLFFSSLIFGLVFIYRFYKREPVPRSPAARIGLPVWLAPSAMTVALVILGWRLVTFFAQNPLDYHWSDVIPLIQVTCRRLLAGDYPYAMVTEFGWDENMTYLPLHWGPMAIAQLLHIDPRWIPYGIWGVTAIFVSLRTSRNNSGIWPRAVAPVLMMGALLMIFKYNNDFLAVTVELLIAAYYILFIISLNTSNGWLQGLTIGLCLLSRYSVVLWLPLYVTVLLITGRRKQLFIATGVAATMVLIFYVLPFLTRDPHLFFDAYHYYGKAAHFEWTHLVDGEHPVNLFAGTGFAWFFYTHFTALPVEGRIALLQRVHLITCLSVVAVMTLWYVRNRKNINSRIFLMGSFKIYLAFFLFLIQVPYEYLMSVGNFLSIVLFCEQLRYIPGTKAASGNNDPAIPANT